MKTDNHSCDGTCPKLRRISRRDSIKIAVVAGAGLLTACSSQKQMVESPTNPPFTTTDIPIPTAIPSEKSPINSYIAYCGYDCSKCPHYKNDCAGCLAGPDKKVHNPNCEVRVCNVERKLVNCAYCKEYSCSKLETLYAGWNGGGNAKTTLDKIHQLLS